MKKNACLLLSLLVMTMASPGQSTSREKNDSVCAVS
jgi:hypothetical protein